MDILEGKVKLNFPGKHAGPPSPHAYGALNQSPYFSSLEVDIWCIVEEENPLTQNSKTKSKYCNVELDRYNSISSKITTGPAVLRIS